MPDDNLDDEKLDTMMNGDQPAPVNDPPDQPSDETVTDPPAPDNADDDEDEDVDVEVDEASDDPKDIAIRNLRNKNRRLTKKLTDRKDTPPPSPAPAPTAPAPRPTPGSPLYTRFMKNEFRVEALYAERTDPTVSALLPDIEKIMFEEMPNLLEQPNGFQIAKDLAKGRSIDVAVTKKPGAEIHPQTSPARPRGPAPAPKRLTYAEYAKLPEAERVAYENSLIGA